MAWTIRAAEPEDAEQLPAIERAAGAAFRAVPGLEWIADDAVDAAEVHRLRIEAGGAWVAVDERERIVAFLSGESINGAFHVWSLQTHPDRQGRGIGRALIEAAAAHALGIGCDALTLTTFRDVPFNAPFYARCGFAEVPGTSDPALAAILAAEAEHGLPAERRCAMRKELGVEGA